MNNAERKAIERLLARQYKVDEQILKEIAKKLKEIGETRTGLKDITPSEIRKIGQMLKYGNNLDTITKILKDNSNLQKREIMQILEHEAKENLEFSKIFYKAKKVKYIPYAQNKALQDIVKAVSRNTVSMYENIANTTGFFYLDKKGNKVFNKMETAYKDLVDDMIVKVVQGKESFEQALEKQLKVIGENGISYIEYGTGNKRRISSALRMNVMDGLNELSQRQQELMGEQFGADGVEITVHDNPAKDHAPIQGHQFRLKEFENMQSEKPFKDINGVKYKAIKRGIGQWNCYHHIISIVIGVSKPNVSQKELDKIIKANDKGFEFEGKKYSMYEGTQLQRRLENEIRKAKEQRTLARAGGESKLETKADKKIRILLKKYHDLSKISGLPTKLERIRV